MAIHCARLMMKRSYQSPPRGHAKRPLFVRILGSFALISLMASSGWAQTPDVAAVRGRVVDQTGAAIPDTNVVIINQLTGLRRETRTDGSGYYSIAALPLTGAYSLVITRTGFTAQELGGFDLRAGETAA